MTNTNTNPDSPENKGAEPGVLISKVHFEVMNIDVKTKFGQYKSIEGLYQYDFHFINQEEANGFFIEVVKEAIATDSFNTKAITEIGNEILSQF